MTQKPFLSWCLSHRTLLVAHVVLGLSLVLYTDPVAFAAQGQKQAGDTFLSPSGITALASQKLL